MLDAGDMLPDFPDLKRELMRIVTARMRRRVYRDSGVMSEIRRFQSHEGHKFTIYRADGSSETTRYRLTTVDLSVKNSELPQMSPQELLARIDDVADAMAEKVTKQLFEKLRRTAAQAGTATNAAGRPISAELLFEALEKIELDFYEEDESPHELTMFVGPELAKVLARLIPIWRQDPSFDKKYGEVMAKKRAAWRVRESRRKLAD